MRNSNYSLPFDIGLPDLLDWSMKNNVTFTIYMENGEYCLRGSKGCVGAVIPFDVENYKETFKWLLFSLKTGVEYRATNP